MKKIRVALFDNRAEAVPIQQILSLAGIPSEIHEELGLARFWFVTKSAAESCLEVPVRQAEEAKRLLIDWGTTHETQLGAIRCPECGSLQVNYPQFTEKFFLPNLAMGLMAKIGLVEKQFYCEHCHCMWSRQRNVPGHRQHHA